MRMIRRTSPGWTLVEVLVALSIGLVIGGLMLALLGGAWRAWTHTVEAAQTAYMLPHWLERIEADVASALTGDGWRIEGEERRMDLVRPRLGFDGRRELVRVVYEIDSAGNLTRTESSFSRAGESGEQPSGTGERIVLDDLRFGYAETYDATPEWQPEWRDPLQPPRVVRVRMRDRARRLDIERWIPLPPGPILSPAGELSK